MRRNILSIKYPYPISQAVVGLGLGVPLAAAPVTGEYSVIIPCYNKRDTIARVIESVLRQTKKPFEVIVIDDASTDGSLKVLEEFKDKITLIENKENIGKAASINKAIEYVKTPYALILDADTILDERFAHEALRGFHKESVQGVSGLILPVDISASAQRSRLIEYLMSPQSKKVQVKLGGVWTLAGASMMWKTKFLKEHKIPTDTVVEDMDISWLAQSLKDEKGEQMRLGFNPEAISYTEDPKTFKQYMNQVHRWYSIGSIVKKRFWHISKGLKAIVVWSFLESLIPFIWIGLATWLFLANAFLTLALFFGVDLALVTILVLKLSSKYRKRYSKKTILKCIPRYYVYRFINAFMFWRALLFPKKKW